MAYVLPTPDDLKSMYPEFATVSDAVITQYIDMAARNVDTTWFEEDYQRAIITLACHLMAISGIGSGPDSKANNGEMAIYKVIRSGALTLQKFDKASDDSFWQFSASRYGKIYRMLLKLNRGGPRVVGGIYPPTSGFAKDWPL